MKSEHLPINTDNFTPNTQVVFICECGKHYKHSRSLWHHQKTCTFRKINVRPNFQMVMFTLDGAFDNRRARIVMIAHSKATVVFFRTSYHGHPGTSVFNRSIEGEYGHLKLGSYIYFPKGNYQNIECVEIQKTIPVSDDYVSQLIKDNADMKQNNADMQKLILTVVQENQKVLQENQKLTNRVVDMVPLVGNTITNNTNTNNFNINVFFK